MAVPKKNDGKPSANGPVERIIIERKLKTNPEIINRPDMIQAIVYKVFPFKFR